MNPNAVRILNRAADMAGSYGNARTAPERVEAEALAKLVVEHARQELDLFIRYCYQVDERGRWIHILNDGQIRNGVWTPWGGSGKSTLTRSQRDTLRLWLWQAKQNRRFPLFIYRPERRRWYVDLLRNPTEHDALEWLGKCGLNEKAWLGVHGCVG
jgi:hypothetical protein